MNVIAQILGIGAMISLFSIYQQRERKRMIAAKLSADIFWVAHYLCLGGIAGMIPNFVGIFRELVFINRENKKWANNIIWPILFIIISWGLGIYTFKTPINILPIAASTFVTISLWIKNPMLTKIITIPVTMSFMVYDLQIGSIVGVINESISLLSIIISFIRYMYLKRRSQMSINQNTDNMENKNTSFSEDCITSKELKISEEAPISVYSRIITSEVSDIVRKKGDKFADQIEKGFVSDFEKTDKAVKNGLTDNADKMAHVSTFIVIDGMIYMTYYANTKEPSEDPKNQTARFVYCPMDDTDNKTFLDIQASGDTFSGKEINMVYDTILMQKDDNTIYIMWTAMAGDNYYRFYRSFTISTKTLGEVKINRFKVNDTFNDFSVSGIKSALSENDINCKKMYSDIGIMQKLSYRMENGEKYYYTGSYSGDFTCIIKSRDLITWEYVSQPDFINQSKWENATYVIGDKCFYFVRQNEESKYGFLTSYNLSDNTWEKPILIEDCQSRSDFIVYNDNLYLFHAPIDREHIGIIRIDTENIENSQVVLQAKMHTSCFYPFIQYFKNSELAMSYTVDRKHIRLAEFTLNDFI